jgi:cytochrome c2
LLYGVFALSLLAGCGDERAPLAPRGQASQLPAADIMRGRQLIADYGCVACHTIEGINGPGSRVGPPLKNLALRGYVGGVLPNTPDNLVRWLQNPPAIDPLTAMPDMGLSVADARDIAAYLLTLH